MVDKCKEFRDRLNVKNYEYEGSANFLEEELLRRELKTIQQKNPPTKEVRKNNKNESYATAIREAVDELFLR